MPKAAKRAATVPVELHHEDFLPVIRDMKDGDYGWAMVYVDKISQAFVFSVEPIRQQQGELWPHLITKTGTKLTARLLTQRVTRVNAAVYFSGKDVIPIDEVEL